MYDELKTVLTDGEIKVYLALLQLGSSTVGPIVEKSGVAYSNIYEILNRLMEKGLVSFVIKAKTKYFQASPPKRLIEFIDKKEEELNKKKKKINKIVPELEKLQKLTKEKLEAEIFIGLKGLASAYEKMFENYSRKEKWFFFYVYDKETVEITDTFYNKILQRFSNIRLKGVSNVEYKNSWLIKKYKKMIDIRWIDFPIPSNIETYKDKTMIISWKPKPIAFLIHSHDIAYKLRKYLDSVWKIAKK